MKRRFVQVPNQIARCPDLSPSEFRVLVALMSLKPCYPSYEDLARWTGLNRKTVGRVLKELKTKKVLKWKRGHSGGKNNEYFVQPFEKWTRSSRDKKGPKLGTKVDLQNILIRETNIEPSESDLGLANLTEEELRARFFPRKSTGKIDQ